MSLSKEKQATAAFAAVRVDKDTPLAFRLTVTDYDGVANSDEASLMAQPLVPTEGLSNVDMFGLNDPACRLQ